MRVDAVFSIWLIILIIIPITIIFSWREWKRGQRFKAIRIISVFLMMGALLGIFLKPKYQTYITGQILLLTPGYDAKKVDSLLRESPAIDLMHWEKTPPRKNSKLLSYYDLVDHGKEIRFVLGQGLPAHALALWEEKKYSFIPSELPEGITSLDLPLVSSANRKNILSGTINSRQDKIWLYLNSPAGKEDSVTLSKGKNHFQLYFTPRYAGDFVYTLFTSAKGSDNPGENVPVHVEEDYPLRILFLQHYPTFETQQLKQFLGRKKHLVTVRNQVSKNNFRYEYINTSPVQVNHLTKNTLDNFDLVIADEESLKTCSPVEREILTRNIESGLGLLNLSSSAQRKRSALFPFEITPVKTDTAHVYIKDQWFTLPAISINVSQHPELYAIQKNKNRILSGYTFSGVGKIGFQLLQETYRLALSGDSTEYASLWTPLLEKITRIRSSDSKIKIVSPFPLYENEPIDIEMISAMENESLFSDGIRIPLREDVHIDNVWYARTWPTSSGWHSLTTSGGSSLSYYVFKRNAWSSLAISNQMESTNKTANSTAITTEPIETWREIPLILWYVIFLLAAGFIWLAPKL